MDNNERIIYHGSSEIIEKPQIVTSGFYKDFGYAFYCTSLKEQAAERARSKIGNTNYVNVYTYKQNQNLKMLVFEDMSDEWLDFIAACRHGEKHDYDIVEGPMVDDQIWNWVEKFFSNEISREFFWELAKFSHLTHQIAFCSGKALRTIEFVKSEKV